MALARSGKRVLLVSTDPGSNLDEVLGLQLSSEPRAIPGAAGLSALNIDPEAAARAYRERVVGPYRGVLPEAAVTSMQQIAEVILSFQIILPSIPTNSCILTG